MKCEESKDAKKLRDLKKTYILEIFPLFMLQIIKIIIESDNIMWK